MARARARDHRGQFSIAPSPVQIGARDADYNPEHATAVAHVGLPAASLPVPARNPRNRKAGGPATWRPAKPR